MARALVGSDDAPIQSWRSGRAGFAVVASRIAPGGLAHREVDGAAVALAFSGTFYSSGGDESSRGDPPERAAALLGSYLLEGPSFLKRLRGDFVIALWDGRAETLRLATDPFRVRPVYYAHPGGALLFASRLRGILASPLAPPCDLSPEAILDVVGSSVIPTPRTIYRHVRKLPPGTCLVASHGAPTLQTYWDVDFLSPSGRAEGELAAETRRLLWESVRMRLPEQGLWNRIGCFLSGGVDSTTVTAILTDLTRRPVKAFSIGFDIPRFNEMNYARIAASALGAEHHEHIVSPEEVREAIPVLVEHFDEPYANASAVPTFICARLARDHGIEILFGGDGGDELFAGNERYSTQRIFDYYTQIPGPLRRYLVHPLTWTVARLLPFEPFVKGEKYVRRARIPYPERVTSYDLFHVIPPAALFEADFLATLSPEYSPFAHLQNLFRVARGGENLTRHLYVDLKVTISDNDLIKVTRMCDASAVAVRFPFLDPALAGLAGTIPARRLMRGAQLRTFFKKAFADVLPLEVRRKRKHGFGLPIADWLRTDPALREMMHDLLLSPASVQRGLFQPRAVEELVRRHETDETSFYGTVIWNLMMLELWLREPRNRGGVEPPRSPEAAKWV